MSKIIIKNNTDISDLYVMHLVGLVIKEGRISNNDKQYCYMTVFNIDEEEYHIVTDLRKCSDVFTFYKSSRK
jgi:hypothetical protein